MSYEEQLISMEEKVTAEEAKEVQALTPVIGDMVTVIRCETGTEIQIKLTDVYGYGQSLHVSGNIVTEQSYVSRYDGKEHLIPVGDYFEAISAYGKYWSIYEPHCMSGDDSRIVRILVGHEEAVVISKEEGIIDYQRTR